MFEFTYEDSHILNKYINEKKAYPGGVYDFTYEGRYLIYHAFIQNTTAYIVIDMKNDQASRIVNKKLGELIPKDEYGRMIPLMYKALTYTGEFRYGCALNTRPFEAIEDILKNAFTAYGFDINEHQIELAKSIYSGLMKNKITICETLHCKDQEMIMAYLLAGFLVWKNSSNYYRNDLPIIICTDGSDAARNAIKSELSKLSSMLFNVGIIQKPLKAVGVKGRQHYLCPKRFEAYMRDISKNKDKHKELLNCINGINPNKLIDLDSISIHPDTKKKICVKGSCRNCKRKPKCPYAKFASDVRKDNEITYMIVSNSVYLGYITSGFNSSVDILPMNTHVIIENGRGFYQSSKRILSQRISDKEIHSFLNSVTHSRNTSISKTSYLHLIDQAHELTHKIFERIKESQNTSNNIITELDSKTILQIDALIFMLETIDNARIHKSNYSDSRGTSLCQKLKKLKEYENIDIWIGKKTASTEVRFSPKNSNKELYDLLWSKDAAFVLLEDRLNNIEHFT